MSDLVEFLRARLNEDEALAEAATPGPWLAMDAGVVSWDEDDEGTWPVDRTQSNHDHADRQHIARWDPARVLAEVAAKRAILDEHSPDPDGLDLCRMCGCGDCYQVKVPCPTLRIIVQPYAGHPEFDPAWRTDG